MNGNNRISTEEAEDFKAFIEKNRRPLFGVVVVIGIACVGFTAAMIVREELNKRAIAKLEPLMERYEVILKSAEYADLIKDSTDASAPETETSADVEKAPETIASFLIDVVEFAASHSGYPAAEAWSIDAHLKAKQGKWAEAEESYLKAAITGKKTHLAAISYFNAAVCAEEQDKIDEAIANYGEAASIVDFAQGAHAQFSIGRLYEKAQKKDEALDAYQILIDTWPDSETWAQLAHRQLIVLGEKNNN